MTFISIKSSTAQTLIPKTEIKLQLADQTEVTLMESLRGKTEGRRIFYYLPTHLRFSTKRNSHIKEFSFLGYRDRDDGPLSGGIMHFLLTWGLTKEQAEEASTLLYAIDSTARFIGSGDGTKPRK